MSRTTPPRKDTSSHYREESAMAPQEDQLLLFNGWLTTVPEHSRTLDVFDEVTLFLKAKSGVRSTPEPIGRTKPIGAHMVTIQTFPAAIQMAGKKAILAIPAAREELVEKTIRKLAVQQVAKSGLHVGDQTGMKSIRVIFTLAQLRRELADKGHGYKLSEIKTALEILSRSTISLTCPDNKALHGIEAPIFAELSFVYGDGDEEGQKSYVAVCYHPLATQSILKASFWPINYGRVMRLKSSLARWLTERINHHYRQADKTAIRAVMENKGYHISLSKILAESGLQKEERIRNNIAQVRAALQQMKDEGVLYSHRPYTEAPKTVPTKGRSKVVDVVWTLFLSQEFTEEILEGNVMMKQVREAGGNRSESLALGPLFTQKEGEIGAKESPTQGNAPKRGGNRSGSRPKHPR